MRTRDITHFRQSLNAIWHNQLFIFYMAIFPTKHQKMRFLLFLITRVFSEEDCLLCQILDDNPLKLAPSQAQIDQLLLHHVLVKMAQIEETQRQLIEKNAILDKISSLVQVVIKSTGKFEQLEKRVNELESSVTSQGT